MRPVIFQATATFEAEAGVWVGTCDEIPAATDAATLDELLDKLLAITLDLLPDNHAGVDPKSVYIQLNASYKVSHCSPIF